MNTRTEPAAYSTQPYVAIPMVQVESSQVACIGYDAERKTLAVQFKHGAGAIYHYPNIAPEFHAAFMAAESKGKFFRLNVRLLPFEKFPPQPAGLDLSSDAPLERAEPAGTGETCESCQ